MRSASLVLVTTLVVGFCGGNLLADTWCNSNFPGSVFCDDFDRYCDPAPPVPDACATDATASDAFLRAVWVPQGTCGTLMKINSGNNYIASLPYSARYPQQNTYELAYHKAALPQAMIGTDENPLVLRYSLDTQTTSTQTYNNAMIELSMGSDRAPTDYVLSDNCFTFCTTNPGPDTQYNVICQQDFPAPNCPPAFTTPRASIAVGLLAYLDNNPCHCDSDSQRPQNSHLNVFDGLKWHILKSNVYPGSGDFTVRKRWNHVTITVKTSTIDVEMLAVNPDPDEYNIATIPRQYTGPFDSVNYGVPAGCLLSSTSYECQTPGSETCLLTGPSTGAHEIDNLVLTGGEQVNVTAACCLNDASCVEVTQSSCLEQNGLFKGYGSSCDTTVCCPYPFADTDHDGDVDQDDFGAFQVCYNGAGAVPTGCECFDRNNDGKVDATDFNEFNNCFTGANVPWAQNLTPSCTP